MSVDVVQLTGAEFDEGMAFLNEVFGEHRPHDFARLLPSIYQPTDKQMSCNHAVRIDGQIRAIVGLFPMQWHVGDTVLTVGGIGGVSTHSSVRGAGYMKLLMNHCVRVMGEQAYDLSWLGGQRQRYGYFGYEVCGTLSHFSLSPTNVRHALPETQITFTPIESDDETSLSIVRRLHDGQTIHCRRDHDTFHRFLVVGYRRPFLASDEQGNPLGYLVADEKGGAVAELVAENDHHLQAIAGAWVRHHGSGVSFSALPASTSLIRQLGALSEGVRISSSGNWQIFDWSTTIQALLRVRAASTPLPDGKVALGIQGYGTLEIDVTSGSVECRQARETAPVTWDAFTAMRVFFGPGLPESVVEIPKSLAALHSWCPLPLGWPSPDQV